MDPISYDAIPWGTRVRVVRDIDYCNFLGIQVGDTFQIRGHTLTIEERSLPREGTIVISVGSEGTLAESPYSSGIYDYTKECPVTLENVDPALPTYIGLPWEALEVV